MEEYKDGSITLSLFGACIYQPSVIASIKGTWVSAE